ncbi:hypothetical protein [Massilia sp. IC2-476]|uniref:hypothetical protein n=1 Tax=Massilia sp. IC2-476 TaxID=2887199 RepID=UPI001D107FD2|nr:hypothetical protein [Massilia sp. IC2-476]MCC2971635.1 hypothetical protein [Massilia sp. IC2-476]
MKNLGSLSIAILISCTGAQAFASGFPGSAKGDFLDNPFLAYGFNPTTKVISGYLVALRTAPGRTDECKMAFKGSANELSVKYLAGTWVREDAPQSDQRTSIKIERNEPVLKFHTESLGGECDWILPFVLASPEREIGDEFVVSMNVQNSGDWIGVYVISTKKAKL